MQDKFECKKRVLILSGTGYIINPTISAGCARADADHEKRRALYADEHIISCHVHHIGAAA